jgi:hypothetical protein
LRRWRDGTKVGAEVSLGRAVRQIADEQTDSQSLLLNFLELREPQTG